MRKQGELSLEEAIFSTAETDVPGVVHEGNVLPERLETKPMGTLEYLTSRVEHYLNRYSPEGLRLSAFVITGMASGALIGGGAFGLLSMIHMYAPALPVLGALCGAGAGMYWWSRLYGMPPEVAESVEERRAIEKRRRSLERERRMLERVRRNYGGRWPPDGSGNETGTGPY